MWDILIDVKSWTTPNPQGLTILLMFTPLWYALVSNCLCNCLFRVWAVKIEFSLKHPTSLFFSSQRCRDRTRQYHRSHHLLVSTYTPYYISCFFFCLFLFSWVFIRPNLFYKEFLLNFLFMVYCVNSNHLFLIYRVNSNHPSQYTFHFYGFHNNPPTINILTSLITVSHFFSNFCSPPPPIFCL